MKRSLAAALCFFLLISLSPAQDSEKRPMNVDDVLAMVDVGSGLISPDGSWALYAKTEVDWKENKRKTTYWRVSTRGGDAYQYIGEEGANSPRFSAKGTYLGFLRKVGEKDDSKNQVFIMRTSGGEAVQLTEHETSVSSFRFSEDESKVFFQADEAPSEERRKEIKKGDDAIYVDEGPHGQRRDQWNNLWVMGIDDKEEARVTDEKHLISSWDVAPDSSRIVYVSRFENRRNQGNLAEIHLVNVQDKLTRKLTDNKAPEGRVEFAPDGKRFLYTAPDDQQWELRQDKIWVMDADSGEYAMVSGNFPGTLRGEIEWSPDGGSIYFGGLERTDANLYRLEVESGSVEQLSDVKGTLAVSSFSADCTRYVYTQSDFDTPEDLWAGTVGGEPVRLTEANPWVEEKLLLADMRVVEWKSSDGLPVEGLLHLPPGYREGRRVPLILHIHGGPAGVFTNSFGSRYHVYAGLGYASLSPNVRGSSGYGDEFLRGNMRDIGGGDYQDLMTGVDHVIETGVADPERMGVRGWSYGGILGGWAITRTDRFKAASLGAMVSDWTSEYGPGFNHDVRLWYIGGTPWENPKQWRQKSSLTHIAQVETPTILFHGIDDRTDTEAQSMMYFTALKDRGVPVRYLRFPREGHGIREPRHFRRLYVEEVDWMQHYVVDNPDWQPWERPKEEEEDKDKVEGAEVRSGN